MVTRSNAHGPAMFQMSTGFIFQGFPSIGSWVSYGLGSENANLPSFVVLPDRRGLPPCGVANWGNGFLPAAHQGVIFGDQTTPIAESRLLSSDERATGSYLRSAERRSTKNTSRSIRARMLWLLAFERTSWRRECR